MITNLAKAKNALHQSIFAKFDLAKKLQTACLASCRLTAYQCPFAVLLLFCVADKTLRQSVFEKFLSALKVQLKCNLLRTWGQAFVFRMRGGVRWNNAAESSKYFEICAKSWTASLMHNIELQFTFVFKFFFLQFRYADSTLGLRLLCTSTPFNFSKLRAY